MAPIGRFTQEFVATIDGLLLSLPIPLTPISWTSVDILTERATKELLFKASEEGKDAAAKLVEAEQQAIDALQAKVHSCAIARQLFLLLGSWPAQPAPALRHRCSQYLAPSRLLLHLLQHLVHGALLAYIRSRLVCAQ